MKQKKGLTLLTLLAFLAMMSFSLSPVTAAPSLLQSEWIVPFLGSMNVPIGFSAVEVKEFKKIMEKEKASAANKPKPIGAPATLPGKPSSGTPDFLPADFPVDKAMERMQKADFALYHLTMDDGEAIHMAWFLAATDGEKMPADVDVFQKDPTAEQLKKLDEFKAWVDSNKEKAQYSDPKAKMAIKLLDMLPAEMLQQGDKKMWTIGARTMFTADDMPFAFFARAYVFSVNDRLAGGILFGLDGERPFWDPVMRQVLQGLDTGKVN